MPCHDSREGDNSELLERLDAATKAACEMASVLRETPLVTLLSPQTRLWIKEHRRADDERLAVEREARRRKELRTRALDKLSVEEREMLGLKY